MGIPLKFKQLMSISEAASYLTECLRGEVSIAEVLQLGLDGPLKLSVDFPEGTVGQRVEFPKDTVVKRSELGPTVPPLEDYLPRLTSNLEPIKGVCDLAMIGGERADIANHLDLYSASPLTFEFSTSHVIFEKSNGEMFCLMEPDQTNRHNLYVPATNLPESLPPVVRREALDDLVQSSSSKEQSKRPLTAGKKGRDNRMSLQIEKICKELDKSNQPIKPVSVWAELIKSIGQPGSCCYREEPNQKGKGMDIVWADITGNMKRLSPEALKGRLYRRK